MVAKDDLTHYPRGRVRYDLKLWIGDLHEGVAYLPH